MTAHFSYYEVLGLDSPPEDRKAVKRAYSKKLKVTRPEDDLDGFMRLRDAHDMALEILDRQSEAAACGPQSGPVETSYSSNLASEPSPVPKLTYGDLLDPPQTEPELGSETTYAIGPTSNFDAPIILQEPDEPRPLPLIEDLNAILGDSKFYNDREHWNSLFRKARQLDIDDYVDFERLLLDAILQFHGYFEDDQDYYKIDRVAPKFTPSIAASLFKTMNWDKVTMQGYHRSQQIEWLERRMSVRKRMADPVPIPETNDDGNWKVWAILVCAFVLFKSIQLLAGS